MISNHSQWKGQKGINNRITEQKTLNNRHKDYKGENNIK